MDLLPPEVRAKVLAEIDPKLAARWSKIQGVDWVRRCGCSQTPEHAAVLGCCFGYDGLERFMNTKMTIYNYAWRTRYSYIDMSKHAESDDIYTWLRLYPNIKAPAGETDWLAGLFFLTYNTPYIEEQYAKDITRQILPLPISAAICDCIDGVIERRMLCGLNMGYEDEYTTINAWAHEFVEEVTAKYGIDMILGATYMSYINDDLCLPWETLLDTFDQLIAECKQPN